MIESWTPILLYSNLASHMLLFTGVLWCIAFPSRRIYPMADKDRWFYAMWILFLFIFISNPILVVLDWNSGAWSSPLRHWLAVPLIVTGAGLVTWGIATLGSRRTSGLPQGLVSDGPYLITRNPQYVGDAFLFIGVAVFANSGIVAVTHLLTAFVLLLAPIAEEPWLEAEYGDDYAAYRLRVPRFV